MLKFFKLILFICLINHFITILCYLLPPILKLDEVIAAPDMLGGTLEIILTMQDILIFALYFILFS